MSRGGVIGLPCGPSSHRHTIRDTGIRDPGPGTRDSGIRTGSAHASSPWHPQQVDPRNLRVQQHDREEHPSASTPLRWVARYVHCVRPMTDRIEPDPGWLERTVTRRAERGVARRPDDGAPGRTSPPRPTPPGTGRPRSGRWPSIEPRGFDHNRRIARSSAPSGRTSRAWRLAASVRGVIPPNSSAASSNRGSVSRVTRKKRPSR